VALWTCGDVEVWHSAYDWGEAAFIATGAVLAGVPAFGEFAVSEAGDIPFARGSGLLNSNNYFRIGWSWSGGAAWGVMNTLGQEVFRIQLEIFISFHGTQIELVRE